MYMNALLRLFFTLDPMISITDRNVHLLIKKILKKIL